MLRAATRDAVNDVAGDAEEYEKAAVMHRQGMRRRVGRWAGQRQFHLPASASVIDARK
jgi:hypothetical protein